MHKNKKNILTVTSVALSVAILTVCSWISIPLGPVPFTMQTFAIFLIAGLFGWKMGLSSVVIYILLGAIGIPVFSGFKGGVAALLGPTGGYIIGFIATALIIALFKSFKKGSTLLMAVGMVLGLAVCYAFGSVWFYYVYTNGGNEITMLGVLSLCVIPFLIPDLVKLVIAVIIVNRVSVPLRKIGFDFEALEKSAKSNEKASVSN